jgi:CheY-like chemotaxis protein
MPSASILVVDDNPVILENMGLALVAAGYDVATAGDGLAALDLLEAQPVDLVVSDVVLPRLDGRALYQRVREDPRWEGLPFLFITGHELQIGEAQGWHLEPCLCKPIQPEQLLAAVQHRLTLAD